MDQIALRAEQISKSFQLHREKSNLLSDRVIHYGKKDHSETLTVLKDVSFEVKRGEMIGIIGKNGAGKTTLLRILAGILQPSSGKLIINGKLMPLLQLGIGFNQDLAPIDNIVMYGMILGFSKKEITAKIPSILEFAELEKFSDIPIRNFSSGMRARLAFSVALSVDPDILLVDEILSVGDIAFQQKSFSSFMDLKKRGKTIVFVTHNLEQIRNLCDNAILLYDGMVAKTGNPSDVIRKYMELNYQKAPTTLPTSTPIVEPSNSSPPPNLSGDLFQADSSFLKTLSDNSSINRLNWRAKVLIKNNEFAIKDKSILDLGSNNGSFIHAAISSGAKFVEGIEARPSIADLSTINLEQSGVDKKKYRITKGNVFETIWRILPGTYDTVLCFGIMSKIISHPDLIYRIAKLKPSYLLIDTDVAEMLDPVVLLKVEDHKLGHNTIRGDGIAGVPSASGLELLLNIYKFKYAYLDWNKFGISDWTGLEDYRSKNRISLIATPSENSKE